MYRTGSIVLSLAIVGVGLAMLAVTVANGGGPLSAGVILGVLFCALGAGRLYLLRGGPG